MGALRSLTSTDRPLHWDKVALHESMRVEAAINRNFKCPPEVDRLSNEIKFVDEWVESQVSLGDQRE